MVTLMRRTSLGAIETAVCCTMVAAGPMRTAVYVKPLSSTLQYHSSCQTKLRISSERIYKMIEGPVCGPAWQHPTVVVLTLHVGCNGIRYWPIT